VSVNVGTFCAWPFVVLAIAVGIGSAAFFVSSIGGDDAALAWASLFLYVGATLVVAACSLGLLEV
jgi:hypothetical protein